MERSVVKRSDAGGGWGHSAELQFGSLPIAGHLWRGTPVGSWVVRGQGIQGPLTVGLPEGFQLPGQHVTPANPQEGGQAPAQALGGLHPGAVVEKLAHGVSGEVVREHGRERRHVPLGLGGGGAVGLQEGQVAAAEAALLHDAAATAAPAGSAGRSAEIEAAVPTDKLEGVHQLPAAQGLTGAVSSEAARGDGQEGKRHQHRLPHWKRHGT